MKKKRENCKLTRKQIRLAKEDLAGKGPKYARILRPVIKFPARIYTRQELEQNYKNFLRELSDLMDIYGDDVPVRLMGDSLRRNRPFPPLK